MNTTMQQRIELWKSQMLDKSLIIETTIAKRSSWVYGFFIVLAVLLGVGGLLLIGFGYSDLLEEQKRPETFITPITLLNITSSMEGVNRTVELQCKMHGSLWTNRTEMVDQFIEITQNAWDIGNTDDSFMRLTKDETCIMMYEKFDTHMRHFTGSHMQLRARSCLNLGDPHGGPSIDLDQTRRNGSNVGRSWMDIKKERGDFKRIISLPWTIGEAHKNSVAQKIEEDAHACRSHFSRASKFSSVPFIPKYKNISQVMEYVPSLLELISLPMITAETKLEMKGHQYKWERSQTGIIPQYNIKFKSDLWIQYTTEHRAQTGCCKAPRSLEYSLRLYSNGMEDFDPTLMHEIRERYKKISRTKYTRERPSCTTGIRSRIAWGAGLLAAAVLLSVAIAAFRIDQWFATRNQRQTVGSFESSDQATTTSIEMDEYNDSH